MPTLLKEIDRKERLSADFPELQVGSLSSSYYAKYKDLFIASKLSGFVDEVEAWTSDASTHALRYLTHGVFRYFGKFPPPIARYLIKEYTQPGDRVIDPMCGSGTTGVESLILDRQATCFDISPLSVLLTKVKVTHIDYDEHIQALEQLLDAVEKNNDEEAFQVPGLRNANHWFLPETVQSLTKIKNEIANLRVPEKIKDALTISFLGIVRKVSRATTQQGRLFLDVETAEKDAIPAFAKRAAENARRLSKVPNEGFITVLRASTLDSSQFPQIKSNLVICHPPYFNSYKYSGISSLELAWMSIDHSEVRKGEVREAFKVGKPERVGHYLEDMEKTLRNLSLLIEDGGVLALMIGDTQMKGNYIPVTQDLLRRVEDIYYVERVAFRIPKYTEASWAASQRRKSDAVGINLCDFVIIMRKK